LSIIIDETTKLVVSGLTGREGSFHGLRNRDYGTDLVAGVTPGKGGQEVEGVPVFDSIAESVAETGANTSMIFVPARFAAASIDEAIDSGVGTVIAITEGIPVMDMLGTYWKAREKGVRLIGPNCPGILSPGKANVGIIPAQFFDPGRIGVVSKSGTLTYQIGNELKQGSLHRPASRWDMPGRSFRVPREPPRRRRKRWRPRESRWVKAPPRQPLSRWRP
jgi:succinyl-CoA synthetase alpha subunit